MTAEDRYFSDMADKYNEEPDEELVELGERIEALRKEHLRLEDTPYECENEFCLNAILARMEELEEEIDILEREEASYERNACDEDREDPRSRADWDY